MAGKGFVKEAAMAKYLASVVAERVTSRSLEIFGGYGYTKEFPAEKYYRDAKIGKICEGGMGVVYKAFDPFFEREVAIKTVSAELSQDSYFRERFFSEARSTGKLKHPNIITVHDLGEEQGRPYLVMEYLEGYDLKS